MFVQMCNTTLKKDVLFDLFRAEPRVDVGLFDCSLACLYFRESKFNNSSFYSRDSPKLFSFSSGQFYFKKLKCVFQ